MKKTLYMAVAGLLACQANATEITQNASFSGATDLSAQNLTFDQFDTSLGTLNSVTIGLTGNVELSTSMQNNTVLTLAFTVGDNFLLDSTIPGGMPLTLSKDLSQNFSILAGGSASLTTSGTVVEDETLTSALSAWEGRGNVVLVGDASGSVGVTGTDLLPTIGSTAGLNASVTYDYTPAASPAVPEGPLPCWAAFSGLGLVFWYAAREKKRLLTLG